MSQIFCWLFLLANALQHRAFSQNLGHRTPRFAWECGGRMGLHGTVQPPRCESGSAAFEAAVDLLSDAHVHPSGKSVVYRMSS